MAFPEPYNFFIEPLERAGLTYCITGSIASGLYGEPRLTHDIDVILTLALSELTRLQSAFPDEQYYIPPVEAILTEVRRELRGMFNLMHHGTGFKADIFLAARDPGRLGAPPPPTPGL